jgi:hypothetical protein
MIHKEKKFANQVLPMYFKATGYNFTYFTHSLKRWGFCQVESGQDKGAYYRQDFFPNNPDICLRIFPNTHNNAIHHHQHQQPPTPLFSSGEIPEPGRKMMVHHQQQSTPLCTYTPTIFPSYTPLTTPGGMPYYGAMPYDMRGTPTNYHCHWPQCPQQYYYPVY